MSINGVGVSELQDPLSQSLGHKQRVNLSGEPSFSGGTVRAPKKESLLCNEIVSVCFGPLPARFARPQAKWFLPTVRMQGGLRPTGSLLGLFQNPGT